MGFNSTQEARKVLHENHIPTVEFPSDSGVMFSALLNHSENQKREQKKSSEFSTSGKNAVQLVFSANGGLKHWGEHQTRKVLSAYDIPLVTGMLAIDEQSVRLAGKQLGYPLVAKGASSDILHKTDAQAVKIGIQDEAELSKAYKAIMKNMAADKPKRKNRRSPYRKYGT